MTFARRTVSYVVLGMTVLVGSGRGSAAARSVRAKKDFVVTQAGLPSPLRGSACPVAPRPGSEPATPSSGGWVTISIQVSDFPSLFTMLRPSAFPRSGEVSEE